MPFNIKVSHHIRKSNQIRSLLLQQQIHYATLDFFAILILNGAATLQLVYDHVFT